MERLQTRWEDDIRLVAGKQWMRLGRKTGKDRHNWERLAFRNGWVKVEKQGDQNFRKFHMPNCLYFQLAIN